MCLMLDQFLWGHLCLYCDISCFSYFFIVCWFFSKSTFWKNSFSVKQIGSRSGPTKMSGLIWVRTVCKSYQQTALVGKELNEPLMFEPLKLRYMYSIFIRTGPFYIYSLDCCKSLISRRWNFLCTLWGMKKPRKYLKTEKRELSGCLHAKQQLNWLSKYCSCTILDLMNAHATQHNIHVYIKDLTWVLIIINLLQNDKMLGKSHILSLFPNSFNKFNQTWMLDSIYHRTLSTT